MCQGTNPKEDGIYIAITTIPWEVPKDPKLQQFLQPAAYCDLEHTDIRETAIRMIEGKSSPKEAAISLFYFASNSIKWTVWQYYKFASEVLKSGYGTCFNKVTLQIALLRSVRIHARYRYQSFPREIQIRAMPPSPISEMIYREGNPENPITVFAEVYLNDRWIAAGAAIDKFLNPRRAKEWDGENDVSFLEKSEVLEDLGSTAEIHLPQLEECISRFDSISRDLRISFEENIKLYFEFLRSKLNLEEKLNELGKRA